jgi:hypothetical protein
LAYADIPENRRSEALRQVRLREIEIEHLMTHDMLDRKVSEGRWTPRRQMLVMLAVLAVFMATLFFLTGGFHANR